MREKEYGNGIDKTKSVMSQSGSWRERGARRRNVEPEEISIEHHHGAEEAPYLIPEWMAAILCIMHIPCCPVTRRMSVLALTCSTMGSIWDRGREQIIFPFGLLREVTNPANAVPTDEFKSASWFSRKSNLRLTDFRVHPQFYLLFI